MLMEPEGGQMVLFVDMMSLPLYMTVNNHHTNEMKGFSKLAAHGTRMDVI